jgi:integrase/recombinase XerD
VRTRAAGSLFSLLTQYVDHLSAQRYSQSSIDKARGELPRLFEYLSRRGVRSALCVTEAHLAAYMAQRRRAKNRHGEPLSVWTLSATASNVKRFFAYLERCGAILRDPAAGIPVPTDSRLPRHVLTEPQVRRLLAVPLTHTVMGKRDRAILETLYGTGVRVGELSRADLGDLDLAQGLLFVRTGKGRKDRLVPVPKRARFALAVYLDQSRPELERQATSALFLNKTGGRMKTYSVDELLGRLAPLARVRATPHALRHACATHLLQGGADIRHVQLILGHKRLTTTALYAHVAIKDLREIIARAHPRERKMGRAASALRRVKHAMARPRLRRKPPKRSH